MFNRSIGRRIVATILLAGVFALGGIKSTLADDPVLGIRLEQQNYTPYTATSTANPLIVAESFGSFALNVIVNYLNINPLSLDLGSLNVSSLYGGTLTIIASATGLTSPVGLIGFVTQLSGNYWGGIDSVSVKSYVSDSNTMFGTDTPLSSIGGTDSPFAASGNAAGLTSAPFALTEVVTIKASGFGAASVDASVTAAPEINAGSGAAAIALLLGIVALRWDRSRREPLAA